MTREEASEAAKRAVRSCHDSLPYTAPEILPERLGRLAQEVMSITEEYMRPQFIEAMERVAREAFAQGLATVGTVRPFDVLDIEKAFKAWWEKQLTPGD